MANDLLIFELFDLPGLVESGALVSLGGQRYQFTRDYLHNPVLYPRPRQKPQWKIQLSGAWRANAGNVIQMLGIKGPAPNAQKPGQQAYAFQFEPGSSYQNYHGPTKFIGNAPATKVIDAGPDVAVQSGAHTHLVGKLNPTVKDQRIIFFWIQTAGPVVTLSDTRVLDPTFTAPVVATPAVLTFALVGDGGGPQQSDTVNVTVNP
jgi:hypothetical protein